MLAEINLPSGIYRNGTQYQSRGRWYDANLTRFFEGESRPRKGWAQHATSAVTGKARAILPWIDNANLKWIAVGCSSKLYVYNRAGTQFDITPVGLTAGRDDATFGGGYGSGLYGVGTYGTPRLDTTLINDATVWTLDTLGQYLVGTNADDGRLFEWKLDTAVKAAPLTTDSPPTNNRAVVMTPERFLMALGAGGNPRLVQWADEGSDSVWTPGATNQAGFYQLQTQGRLMCGKRVRGGTLLFTDLDVHLATYQQPPIVYGFQQVGSGCGIISQAAAVVGANVTAWMGVNGFWTYDGSVQPLVSEVGDHVFSNLNGDQKSKVFAVHNPEFGEIDWFYPSASSIEIDSYVCWNYRENHWQIGSLARTCGIEEGVFRQPLMVDASGVLWEHEIGLMYPGASAPYIESGPLELNANNGLTPSAYAGASSNVMDILGMIPDDLTTGDVQVTVYSKFYPLDPTEYTDGPYALAPLMDLRIACREARLRFTFLGDGRVGLPRLDITPGGLR